MPSLSCATYLRCSERERAGCHRQKRSFRVCTGVPTSSIGAEPGCTALLAGGGPRRLAGASIKSILAEVLRSGCERGVMGACLTKQSCLAVDYPAGSREGTRALRVDNATRGVGRCEARLQPQSPLKGCHQRAGTVELARPLTYFRPGREAHSRSSASCQHRRLCSLMCDPVSLMKQALLAPKFYLQWRTSSDGHQSPPSAWQLRLACAVRLRVSVRQRPGARQPPSACGQSAGTRSRPETVCKGARVTPAPVLRTDRPPHTDATATVNASVAVQARAQPAPCPPETSSCPALGHDAGF